MDSGASDPMSEVTKTQVDRKARLKIPPPPVPKQDPKQRVKNWQEGYLGYDLPTARGGATPWIQCPPPPPPPTCAAASAPRSPCAKAPASSPRWPFPSPSASWRRSSLTSSRRRDGRCPRSPPLRVSGGPA